MVNETKRGPKVRVQVMSPREVRMRRPKGDFSGCEASASRAARASAAARN